MNHPSPEAMDEEHVSVRTLSKESGVSTSIIQDIRSMKSTNITIKTMALLLKPLGYQLAAKKGRKRQKNSSLIDVKTNSTVGAMRNLISFFFVPKRKL